jgi:hypothetical protein
MIPLPNEIDLVRAADNHIVQARFVRLTRPVAKVKIDATWWQDLGASTEMRKKENDNSWHWAKRLGDLRNDRWHESFAIEAQDGNIQGAILYWLNTRSFVESEKGAVYLEALATAPRNRPWLVSSPLYRGVGENLLLRAAVHSYIGSTSFLFVTREPFLFTRTEGSKSWVKRRAWTKWNQHLLELSNG